MGSEGWPDRHFGAKRQLLERRPLYSGATVEAKEVDGDDLDAALETALSALEGAGVGRERVILAISKPSHDESAYTWHVGAAHDRDSAMMIEEMAITIKEEAHYQTMALFGDEVCPGCGSVRYGHRQRVREDLKVQRWSECLACGRTDPHWRRICLLSPS